MMENPPRFPFEVPFSELQGDLDAFVAVVFSSLESEFLILPRGRGFVDYPVFERGYEALKQATTGFQNIAPDVVVQAAVETPMVLIVLRTILGFTPSEWAYVASQAAGIDVSQGFVRTLDRRIRIAPLRPLLVDGADTLPRLNALVEVACRLLSSPPPDVGPDKMHRLDKADTREGPDSIRALASMGVPYAMLLYERFMGRPFAGHRDSVSELVGNYLESAIEDVLSRAGISYRRTRRAERITGFDQAPDFIIPDEFSPQVVIEAKVTEDDGTARDKITRVQHLASLSLLGQPAGVPKFEVIACIAGRGFRVRREDMKKLLLATRGKVFTMRTLDRLVDSTRLRDFRST